MQKRLIIRYSVGDSSLTGLVELQEHLIQGWKVVHAFAVAPSTYNVSMEVYILEEGD